MKNMVTIMRESTVKILDDKDMEFVETLRSLSVPRNVATLITFLANVDEASSREIEMGSDLRQPEVSIAMRTLRDNNWIEEKEIKREGKGRPMKVYSLKAGIDDVIKHFEEEKLNESAQAIEHSEAKATHIHLKIRWRWLRTAQDYHWRWLLSTSTSILAAIFLPRDIFIPSTSITTGPPKGWLVILRISLPLRMPMDSNLFPQSTSP